MTTTMRRKLLTTGLERGREPSPDLDPYATHDRETDSGSPVPRLDGVVIGSVVDIDTLGIPLVDFPDNSRGWLEARSLVAVGQTIVGCEVALMFERGDPGKPIVVGTIRQPDDSVVRSEDAGTPGASALADAERLEAKLDGERITLTAEKEIVLRCGKASITLTRAGKVLIKGTYVLTHSGGVNRIRGGSVQIN